VKKPSYCARCTSPRSDWVRYSITASSLLLAGVAVVCPVCMSQARNDMVEVVSRAKLMKQLTD